MTVVDADGDRLSAFNSTWGLPACTILSRGACAQCIVCRNGDLFTATADSKGNWVTYLPPQVAAWNRTLAVSSSSSGGGGSSGSNIRGGERFQSATLSIPVSFGETVLCAGQSNMGMQVGPSVRKFDADNATAENAASVLYSGKIVLHSRFSRWSAAKGVDTNSTVWCVDCCVDLQYKCTACYITPLVECPCPLVENSNSLVSIISFVWCLVTRGCSLTFNNTTIAESCIISDERMNVVRALKVRGKPNHHQELFCIVLAQRP